MSNILGTGTGNTDETPFLDILESIFRSHAYQRYRLVQEEIKDIESFNKLFKVKFWTETIQRNIRRRLENEIFNPYGHMNRCILLLKQTS